MAKRKNDAEFKQEVYALVGDEYKFLDSYQGALTKIKVKHNKCGNVYEVKPNYFLNGRRCPWCYGNIKKTDKQFKQEVFDLVGDEYIFLDSYVNSYTKIKVKHNKCGSIYGVTPNAFFKGNRCPYCYGTPKKTDSQFKQEVYDLVGDEYTFLDAYIATDTKLRVKHNKCGNVYKVQPNAFLHGSRCPYCGVNAKKTNEQFQQEIYDLVGDEYTFLDNYVNKRTKLRVKHNKCGNTYEVTPGNFLQGSRCPYCSNSKGEDIINKILKSLGIKYEYQKAFDGLRDTQPLSYDFYIPSQNILIEYQGLQHYQPVGYFGGKSRFKVQQKHDKMKSEYAKINHYKLITIPYTEDTLTKIKKYLLTHGLSK